MRYLVFIYNSAIEDLLRNKLRTFLTALGILIGITSVVLLSAFGLGFKKYIEDQFKSLGANQVIIMPVKLSSSMSMSSSAMMETKFDDKDVASLRKIKNILGVAPVLVKYAELEANGNAETYELIASSPEIFKIFNFEVDRGRLFDKADCDKKNKVIVLGSKPAEKLFGTVEDAVGKIVKVQDQGYRVAGVLKSKGGGGFGEPGMDDHVFIPVNAGSIFSSTKKYWGLYILSEDDSFVEEVKQNAQKILSDRYDEDEFSVTDQKEMLNMLTSIFDVISMVLTGIAAISLIVGGIGVMNIMYVSVVERVGEIGIRRAVGATDHDILFLFLFEALILCLVGGFLGLTISYGVVILIQSYFPAYINLSTVLLALGVSSAIGIIFGVFPAKKASNLTPIEAMRFE